MKSSHRRGFSLIEVMVASTMVAAMIIALFSFVSMGADVWRRTDQTITLSAEAEMINTYLRNVTMAATNVTTPAVGGSTPNFIFDLPVATGTPSVPSQYFTGSARVRLATGTAGPSWDLLATFTAFSAPAAGKITFNPAEAAANQVDPNRLVATLSSRIATINFQRPQKNILKVALKLISIVHEAGYTAINATPSLSFTGQYYLPNL